MIIRCDFSLELEGGNADGGALLCLDEPSLTLQKLSLEPYNPHKSTPMCLFMRINLNVLPVDISGFC